jgi:cysteine desulfurase/selenocysteine lyase
MLGAMRSEKVARPTPIWEMHRDQFPVTKNLIYLNHAAVAPLCTPAAEAMRRLTEDVWTYGSLHYSEWLDAYSGLRQSAARLLGARPGEIAIVKNTSEGIATVALGLDWRPGDRVVGFREEFPANFFPWKRLERAGVAVDWLSVYDPLDRIEQACRGARLLTISFVQYLSGFRADLEAIGEMCRDNECLFFVDAIQGLGALPLNVARAQIHALSADGHKWLLGPEGCGILYIRQDLQDDIEPVEFGWTNVARYADYESRDMALRPDAGRYECGTLNTVGCFGLRAALDYLLSVGIESIAQHVVALADRIAAGAGRKGYRILGFRTPASASGIVSVRKDGVDSRVIANRLREQRIIVAPRQGWVRASPHFYNSPDDVDRLIEALP